FMRFPVVFGFSLLFFTAFFPLYSIEKPPLKVRQPNWRPHVVESYPNGNPEKVIFYEPTVDGEEPVKQLHFYPNGQIKQEMDVLTEKSPAAENGETSLIAHGGIVNYHPSGAPARTAFYEKGELDGEVKTYHPNGQLESQVKFVQGKKEG